MNRAPSHRAMAYGAARFAAVLLAGVLSSAPWRACAQTAPDPSPDHPIVAAFERFTAPQDDEKKLVEGGLLLLNELNCVSCHAAPQEWAARLPGRVPISLHDVGSRMDAGDIARFIQNPHQQKGGTLMPTLFPADAEGDAIVASLVSYLASQRGEVKKFPQGDAKKGMELYHTIGCVACHQPATTTEYQPVEATPGAPVPLPTRTSVPIKLAAGYDRDALAAFLMDPLAVRAHGRMPSTEMSDQEAADLAAYLQEDKKKAGAPGSKLFVVSTAEADLQKGRNLFMEKQCLACHAMPDIVVKALPVFAEPMGSLKPDQGCLSAGPSVKAPLFSLSELQRKALTLALKELQSAPKPAALTAAQETDTFMKRMDCYACHEARGTGGLEVARGQYFTVLEPTAHSLGEIGRLPPKLDNAGRKITRAWMEKLLWGSGGGVRPYMTARMPRFGQPNCEGALTAFAEAGRLGKPIEMDTSGLAKHHRGENGRVLMGVGKGGLGCVACHGLKDRKGLGVAVVNLTTTALRLRPEYFKELLLNPQVTQPGTLMPPLFVGRKAADKEVEMLWTYLKEIDQSRLPEGLLQTGDYELKPEKDGRPIVFRTFLEGAGMEAVAVGFPQQLHAAFDAQEVRWAIAWKGRFVDAMTTWEERAMTPAKPLGTPVLTLPAVMPLARLESASSPWPESYGAGAGYAFKGYRIAKDGVPTFLYEVTGLKVEDTLRPTSDGKSLLHTIMVKGGGQGWYFRGLAKDASPQALVWKDGAAVFEETLTW